jgi:hypothetical protein
MQLLFKFKGPLLKPKPKIIFFEIFEFFNNHISHLTQHSTINMALKWDHKNIFNKITIFIKFRWSPNVLFGLFDCDSTHPFSKPKNSNNVLLMFEPLWTYIDFYFNFNFWIITT